MSESEPDPSSESDPIREPDPSREAEEIEVRRLGAGDEAILEEIVPGVFDRPPTSARLRAVLADPRHHLAIALDGRRVVGMASAVDYLHVDKPPELWIDEIGVAPGHRGRGIGRRLLEALFEAGHDAGCRHGWVLTGRNNQAARRLLRAVGGVETSLEQVLVEFPLGSDRGSGDRESEATESEDGQTEDEE